MLILQIANPGNMKVMSRLVGVLHSLSDLVLFYVRLKIVLFYLMPVFNFSYSIFMPVLNWFYSVLCMSFMGFILLLCFT